MRRMSLKNKKHIHSAGLLLVGFLFFVAGTCLWGSSIRAEAKNWVDRGAGTLGNSAMNSGLYNRGNNPSAGSMKVDLSLGEICQKIQRDFNRFAGMKDANGKQKITTPLPGQNAEMDYFYSKIPNVGDKATRVGAVVSSLNALTQNPGYKSETAYAIRNAIHGENIYYNVFSDKFSTGLKPVDNLISYAHGKVTSTVDDEAVVQGVNQYLSEHPELVMESDRALRTLAAKGLEDQGYHYYEIQGYIEGGIKEFEKRVEERKKREREEAEISVVFAEPEKLQVSDPDYRDGWVVWAKPDGTLTDLAGVKQSDAEAEDDTSRLAERGSTDENGRNGASVFETTYGYLFYESTTDGFHYQTEEGFFVPADKEAREAVFRRILTAYGLNEQEIADFVDYWVDRLPEGKSYLMYPQLTEAADAYMPVEITPVPDRIFRIWFVYESLEEENAADIASKIPEPEITRFEREGFTVVEWGGIVY